jgi:predicted homoserine dehydrogenase-like protein
MKRFLFFALLLSGCVARPEMIVNRVPARDAGQGDMLGFAAKPIPVVRTGFIGVGMRGAGAVNRFAHIDGTRIVAICDMEQYNLDRAQGYLKERGRPCAEEYAGEADAWKKLCERADVDLVYICTDWKNHTPMAVYAMEHGKHVAVEAPAAPRRSTSAGSW